MGNFRKGFALAEIVIALAFVSLSILLVGALGSQVMNLSKNSKLTAVVLEMRTKTNAISRDSSSWLNKMRSQFMGAENIYAACIPSESDVTTIFRCPPFEKNTDTELLEIANGMKISSAPIIDMMGEEIAGTTSKPLYLSHEGRPCKGDNAITTCPLKSTGYFLRKGTELNSSPEEIRFVIKIESNQSSRAIFGNTTPMKAKYLQLDIGTSWKNSNAFSTNDSSRCPSGIQLGIRSDGTAHCVDPSTPCPSGEVSLGLNFSTGQFNCAPLPDPSCEEGTSAILDRTTNTLVCSENSPCDTGLFFGGYYAGSGAAICLSATAQCAAGEIQVGLTRVGNSVSPRCATLPNCSSTKALSFDGSNFVCDTKASDSCSHNEVISGVNSDGTPICRSLAKDTSDIECAENETFYGISADGTPKCKAKEEIKILASTSAESGGIAATTCEGTYSGGFCSRGYYKDIVFSSSFNRPPKVIVSMANSNVQGCGGATDKDVAYATNITSTGFRMFCTSSPLDSCTATYGGWYLASSCNWIAAGY